MNKKQIRKLAKISIAEQIRVLYLYPDWVDIVFGENLTDKDFIRIREVMLEIADKLHKKD